MAALPLGAETPAQLPPVVVSGLPAARAELDAPAAIAQVDATSLQWGQPRINLSESLVEVPGLSVRNRQNYAQDLQIQSRGFGARSSFGVRGLQLRLDGIPLTAPDGQGAPSGLLLSSLERLEVLRGPLAYAYGNAAGGALAAFSAPPAADTTLGVQMLSGADGSWRGALSASGQAFSGLGYRVEAARFMTEGYRQHSAARRDLVAAHARYGLAPGRQLSFTLNALSQPEAQDPLGLSRAQFEADPRQADAAARNFNTRKSTRERLAGLRYEHDTGAGVFELAAYGSARNIEQFQSIPVAVQAAASHPGGVIDLERDSYGGELRYRRTLGTMTLGAGLQGQRLDEARRGFENFQGTTLGVRGNLRRDEANRVHNFDQFLLADWTPGPHWSLLGALRRSEVRFASEDRYVVAPGNPDDSGRLAYGASTPAAALRFAPDAENMFYASWGRGFETPTFNELSYRPDGSSGLNFALQAARSETSELGWKRGVGARGLFTLSAFHIDGEREIVPASNSGGRASFQNAPGTRRSGAETSLRLPLGAAWSLRLAADYLDAEFSEAYSYVAGGATNTVAAGNRIPGVAASNGYVELAWNRGRPGWSAALDVRHSAKVPVNDLNSDAAAGYRSANLRLAYERAAPWGRYSAFVRCDNLFDEDYAGSVIVNEANGRFFEPAPDRGWHAGVELSLTRPAAAP